MIYLEVFETIPKSSVTLLWLFCVVLLVYICTYIFFMVRPPLHSKILNRIFLGIVCIVGLFVIVFIKFLNYNKYVLIVFLILYSLAYIAAAVYIICKKQKERKDLIEKGIDPDEFHR